MTLPCLGTAGFGMRYGVANTHGQPTRGEVFAMLDLAWERGVRAFDTAPAYGDAETLLGEYQLPSESDVVLVTKTPPDLFSGAASDREALERAHRAFWRSTERLRQLPTHWLLHHAADVFNPMVIHAMLAMRERAVVGIGVSCYEVAEADEAIAVGFNAIQVPLSILDDRFESSGVLARARAASLKVFARSPFCQGAVVLPPERADRLLSDEDAAALRAFRNEVAAIGTALHDPALLDPVAVALAWAAKAPDVGWTVFGVDGIEQLRENLGVFSTGTVAPEHDALIRRDLRQRILAHPGVAASVRPANWSAP